MGDLGGNGATLKDKMRVYFLNNYSFKKDDYIMQN